MVCAARFRVGRSFRNWENQSEVGSPPAAVVSAPKPAEDVGESESGGSGTSHQWHTHRELSVSDLAVFGRVGKVPGAPELLSSWCPIVVVGCPGMASMSSLCGDAVLFAGVAAV